MDPYGNKSTCTSSSFKGPLNITEGSGIFSDLLGQSQLWLTLKGTAEMPSFSVVVATGGTVALEGTSGEFQMFPILDLNQEVPSWETPGKSSIKVKLTLVE
jgi:hypothetical protein